MGLQTRIKSRPGVQSIGSVDLTTDIGKTASAIGTAFLKNAAAFDKEDERAEAIEAGRAGARASSDVLVNGIPVPAVTLRQGTAVSDVAFNQAAIVSYRNRLDTAMRGQLDQVLAGSNGDPDAIVNDMGAWWDGVRQSVPPELQPEFDNKIDRLTSPFVRAAARIQQDAAAARIKAESFELQESISRSSERSANLMSSDDGTIGAEAMVAVGQDWKDLSDLLATIGADGQPVFTEAEQARARRDFWAGVHSEGVKGAFLRSPNKAAFRDEWVDAERANTDSPFALDQIENMETWMRQQERQERAENASTIQALNRQTADAVRVWNLGGTPQNAEVLRNQQAALGNVEAVAAMDEAKNNRTEMEAFRRGNFQYQADEIRELAAKEATGTTLAEQRRLGAMRNVAAATLDAFNKNPYALSVSTGLIPNFIPIDLNNLPASLAARERQMITVQNHYNHKVPLLLDDEAKAMAGRLQDPDTGIQQARAILDSLSVLSPASRMQIDGQLGAARGALGIAVIGLDQNRQMSDDILLGIRLNAQEGRAPTETMIKAATDDSSIAATEIMRGDPTALKSYQDAAAALATVRAFRDGRITVEADDVEEAMRIVLGGVTDADGTIRGGPIKWHGKMTIPPIYGMERSDLGAVMESLTDLDLLNFSWDDAGPRERLPITTAPIFANGEPMTARDLQRGTMWLVPEANGVYAVWQEGAGFVLRPSGGPYMIDLRAFMLADDVDIGLDPAERASPERTPVERAAPALSGAVR